MVKDCSDLYVCLLIAKDCVKPSTLDSRTFIAANASQLLYTASCGEVGKDSLAGGEVVKDCSCSDQVCLLADS